MRTFKFFLVVGLISAAMAAPAFAGDKSDCDFLKKGHDDYLPEYKGLYGLCVAYQNADEEGKDDIIRVWDKRVAKLDLPDKWLPEMPNREGDAVPLYCDCWDDYDSEDICALGELDSTNSIVFPGFGGGVFYDDVTALRAFIFVSWDPSALGGDVGSCEFKLSEQTDQGLDETTLGKNNALTAEQAAQCIAELEVMADPNFCP